MSKKRCRFTADFKKRVALEALWERDTVQAIPTRYEVQPNQVSTWKRQAMEGLSEIFSRPALKLDEEHAAKVQEFRVSRGSQVCQTGASLSKVCNKYLKLIFTL